VDDSPRDDDRDDDRDDGPSGDGADTTGDHYPAGVDADATQAIREDGPRGANFDPSPYFRQLRGRGGSGPQDYLDVKWRLLWLRREHPDAHIVTEHVRIDETSAIFKATVDLPSGGRATGYGSETAGDFGDFIEKAETKAIGRALNALGYGAQFAEGEEDPSAGERSPGPAPGSGRARPTVSAMTSPGAARGGSSRGTGATPQATARGGTGRSSTQAVRRQADVPPVETTATSPAPREPVPIDRQSPAAVAEPTEHGAAPDPSPSDAPDAVVSAATMDRPVRGSGADVTVPSAEPGDAPEVAGTTGPGARPAPASGAGGGEGVKAAEPSGDVDMADYSHTAFWKWAREQGFLEKADVERKIGRPMKGLMPREVRELLIEAGASR